ncbi:MAG TPA: SDR family oxidoreductase [Thermoanaerobaculia bacterium]|nr:SDR family oxidoreductase [Thermoanaerobaculia bacterium]
MRVPPGAPGAPSRREFLWAAAGTALAGVPALSSFGKTRPPDEAPAGKKKLLILGGTRFLGPALVGAARKSGWTLTLFNRGKSNPGLFPDLEQIHGDRNESTKPLEGRKWDAVVDTSGYFPRQIRTAMESLKGNVGQYVFISSISVYADTSKPCDETSPVATTPDENAQKITNENYGALKALCEQAAEKAMPGRVANIRPGLIVGPDDASDRFTYWPVRVAKGGEVLAPGAPTDPVQFIDVRDLAEWTIRLLDAKVTGVFNATGPAKPLGIGELLDACKAVSGSDARFSWVPAGFLEERKVEAWSDMPVWLPPAGETAGANRTRIDRALAKGLTFRPLTVTVKDTLDWWAKQPKERQAKLKAGLSAEREAQVLKAWHERSAPKASS